MGRAFLTNGFVPVGNFGKVLANNPSISFALNSYETDTTFHCLKLAKPLFVPAGETLVAKFQYESKYGDLGDLSVDVIYVGRSLPSDFPTPKEQWLPWIAAFDNPLLAFTAGQADSTLSTQSQLVNPFDEDLWIHRLIGRTQLSPPNGSFVYAELGGGINAIAAVNVFRDTTVRATDSFGRILVRDATPFTHLFHYSDRSWTVSSVLQPKGYYLFQLDRAYTGTQAGWSAANCISMVGYRKVRV
jgi:hypothetical protein